MRMEMDHVEKISLKRSEMKRKTTKDVFEDAQKVGCEE